MRYSPIDASALMLSGLCLVHCLALPLLSAALPLAGVLSEAEWLHRAFVILALPVTLLAIRQTPWRRGGTKFLMLALAGLTLLGLGAFVERLHDHEVLLTTSGAVLLAAAHVWRWRKRMTCQPQ